MNEASQILSNQQKLFLSGRTRDLEFRKKNLDLFGKNIRHREREIFDALESDLGKCAFEGFVSEVGMVLDEIGLARKHLRRWSRPRRARTPLSLMPGKSLIYREPYGSTLVISPWNYPIQLALVPLVGAVAAGNCVVLKPSELAPATSTVVAGLISDTFDPTHVTVLEGGVDVSSALLDQDFDMIFFTGSPPVGKIVMEAAARRLTPVVLELGGKSPCIVDSDVDLKVTSRRIAWGKFLNAGQTCVAPDYVLAHESIRQGLIDGIAEAVDEFYGTDPASNPDFARIVNDRHFERLVALMGSGDTVMGGQSDKKQLYIAPTLLDNVGWDDPIMNEEIFGPLLPVITYSNIDDAMSKIRNTPTPLALYVFTRNRSMERRLIDEIRFGIGCINDAVVQFSSPHLPIGGVGNSGMGSYHGQASFEAFTYTKSVMKRPFAFDFKLRYPPYAGKLKKIRKLIG
jgi:aldehyde dehydrogenase (NAD+)